MTAQGNNDTFMTSLLRCIMPHYNKVVSVVCPLVPDPGHICSVSLRSKRATRLPRVLTLRPGEDSEEAEYGGRDVHCSMNRKE